MKVEVDLTEYGVKAPKWYDPINPHVINASGGSGGRDVELTLAEYEALSEEEKMNGTNYFITDIGNPKSLITKTLIDTPLQSTETIYNLSDSYKNYDYVIVFITDYDNVFIRASSVIYVNAFNSGSVNYTTWTTDAGRIDKWRASASFKFTSDTTIRIYDIFQDSSAWNGGPFTPEQARLRVVGYRYERVIVPNQMVNYSTVEARIGTWIDGKPLYQRSFAFNYSDLNTSETIKYTPAIKSSMISDLKETVDIDAILITNNYGAIPIGCKGYAESNNTSTYIEVSKYYTRVGIISQSINLQNEFNKLYVTVQYTKTTD